MRGVASNYIGLPGRYIGPPGSNGSNGQPGSAGNYNGGNGGNGGTAGYGLSLNHGGPYATYGTIQGGAGGTGGTGGAAFGGYYYRGDGNGGYYFGGNGGNGGAGGTGGVGVDLATSTLTNFNEISGGYGGAGGQGGAAYAFGGIGGAGGTGGAGVSVESGTLTNSGDIYGGIGGAGASGGVGNIDNAGPYSHGAAGGAGGVGGTGGAGVELSGTLTNTTDITGGVGGAGGDGGALNFVYNYPYGVGGTGGTGGAGVDQTSGTLTNSGSITGGTGGAGGTSGYFSPAGPGGTGGAGVDLTSGTLTNSASITGGTGGVGGSSGAHYSSPGVGGAGGSGVQLFGGTLTNNGQITGGSGGAGGAPYTGNPGGNGGAGGAGVYLDGGTLTTSGTISGGAGGAGATGTPNGSAGAAGDAVLFGATASTLIVKPHAVFNGQVAANAAVNDVLKLSGIQSGGTPITLGSQFTNFSSLVFNAGAAWTVNVGAGAAPSGGLSITGFTTSDTVDATNLTPAQAVSDFTTGTHTLATPSDGTLHFLGSGFSGDSFLFSNDGSGGTDVTLVVGSAISTVLKSTVTLGSAADKSPLTISNAGGVAPTAAGAIGVESNLAANSLTNHGAIKAGVGVGNSVGGGGGVGVNFTKGTTLTNTGSIVGGKGGSGSVGAGGVGGAGVNLLAGTLTNTGSITGGAGGIGSTTGGAGGAGVFLNGGTLITAGTISGGAGGPGAPNGAAGDAAKFGTAASTLVVDPGAVFNGQVVANNAHDVLELAGIQGSGTPITLGTQFTNFSTLDFASQARWTVDATRGDLTGHALTVDGFTSSDKLDITNLAAAGTKLSFNTTTDELTITKAATTINLQFNSNFAGKHFVLTADGNGGAFLHLLAGAGAALETSGQNAMNFVSAEHSALVSNQSTSMFATPEMGSGVVPYAERGLAAVTGHGASADRLIDHALTHLTAMVR